MAYHVRVTKRKTKSEPQQLYVRTDMTMEQVQQRFLGPYAEGSPLTIRGATVQLADLEKIEIFESSEPISALIDQVKREWDDAGAANLAWEWDFLAAAKGIDRTDDFIHGPPGEAKTAAVGGAQAPRRLPNSSPRDTRTVFVVHGRDQENADALFAFLRALRLDPREFTSLLVEAGEGAPYVGDVVRRGIEGAGAVVVLVTADDRAEVMEHLRRGGNDRDARLTPQPRPNVIFEAGLAMAAERPRTVFVQIGEVPSFSDVTGRHTVRFDGKVETRKAVAERLRGLGCPVDTSGDQWLRAGDFNFETPERRAQRAKPLPP